MSQRNPLPNHVPGTARGEEMAKKNGREPGRSENRVDYRTARDSTSVNPIAPIDPKMPAMPPA